MKICKFFRLVVFSLLLLLFYQLNNAWKRYPPETQSMPAANHFLFPLHIMANYNVRRVKTQCEHIIHNIYINTTRRKLENHVNIPKANRVNMHYIYLSGTLNAHFIPQWGSVTVCHASSMRKSVLQQIIGMHKWEFHK